jgi:hypothetical protein
MVLERLDFPNAGRLLTIKVAPAKVARAVRREIIVESPSSVLSLASTLPSQASATGPRRRRAATVFLKLW